MRSAQPKRVTLKDLAAHTGLSIGAVSLSLIENPKTTIRVSEDTKERVRKAAHDLGYRHNWAAQVLRKGRTNSIALLSFQGSLQLATRRLHEGVAAVKRAGMNPLIYFVEEYGRETSEQICNAILDHRVDGVLLLSPGLDFAQHELNRLVKFGTPVAVVGAPFFKGVASFAPDKKQAFELITRHLIEEGFQSLALLCHQVMGKAPQLEGWHSVSAMEGFNRAIEGSPVSRKIRSAIYQMENSIDGSEIGQSEEISPFYASGYLGARRLIKMGNLPEALICSSDKVAFGAMRAFAEAGIRIPHDIAVAGFDNDPSSSAGTVPLTSVDHPLRELSEMAVHSIVRMMKKTRNPESGVTLAPCRLVIRQSSVRRTLSVPELLVDPGALLKQVVMD